MKILIIGSTGLLGTSLVPFLREKEYTIFTNENAAEGESRADFSNYAECDLILKKTQPDTIINLAAQTNVDECERNPKDAYLINVKIVENIAKWIKSNKPDCFLIQMASDQVYDGGGPHEESEVILSNYYGFSKYAGELAAGGVQSTILRTNFFGLSHCHGRESLSDWIFRCTTKKIPITVYENVYFSPLSLKSMTHYMEIVVKKRIPGVFNLGSKEGMNKADFAFYFCECLGLSTKNMIRGISTNDLNAYRPKDMRMDSSLFEKIFQVTLPTLKHEILEVSKEYEYKTRK